MFEQNSKDSFYFTTLYGAYYALLDTKVDFEFCQSEDKFLEVFGQNVFEELEGKRDTLQLDLNSSTFHMQYHVIDNFFMNRKLLLRVYELRKKVLLCNQKSSTKKEYRPKRSFGLC